jgi:hypothetical protein
MEIVSRGKLLAYLNSIAPETKETAFGTYGAGGIRAGRANGNRRRVADRSDLQPLLPFGESM